jgi:hypothetical protein
LLGKCPVENGDGSPGAERSTVFDPQAPPREIIDQTEDQKRLAVGAKILEEIIGPNATVTHGSDRHRSRLPRRGKRRRCLGRFKPQFLPQAPLPEAQG